jgi:hypothetical protein
MSFETEYNRRHRSVTGDGEDGRERRDAGRVIVDGLAVELDPRVALECVLARQPDPELRLEPGAAQIAIPHQAPDQAQRLGPP